MVQLDLKKYEKLNFYCNLCNIINSGKYIAKLQHYFITYRGFTSLRSNEEMVLSCSDVKPEKCFFNLSLPESFLSGRKNNKKARSSNSIIAFTITAFLIR